MKIKKGFVIRKVGEESLVVPVGAMSKTFHGMIKLNATGEFLWNFYTAEHSIDDGVEALLGVFDVEEELARTDVTRFVNTLLENGFAD